VCPPLLGAWLSAHAAEAAAPMTIVVDSPHAGASIPAHFAGLSYESALLLPGSNGKYFFTSENKPLVQMFCMLGIKSLRVGGNTAERASVPIAGKADIDHLFGFATAAGVKIIYTLRLKDAKPQADEDIARYIMEHYRPDLTCFALGNEPEKMAKDFAGYRDAFQRFLEVITAPTNVPEARFCGPSTTHLNSTWAGEFARTFGRDRRVALVTQHEYPGHSGIKLASLAVGLDRLLSPNLLNTYQALYDNVAPAARSNGMPYRLEEANSFSNGGAAGISDAFAAARWGLDYLYWWAGHGAEGVNFHTGGYAPGTPAKGPMKYAVFWNSKEGFAARPLAYALKAFALSANRRLVPATVISNPAAINLRAYAVLAADNTVSVVLINKEYGPEGRDAQLTVGPGTGYAGAQMMFLSSPGGDVQAKSGQA
jgi:hypothetical protein